VSVHPEQSSLDTSKLPRPSIIFDETANNNTDQHTTFRDKLEHLDHWQIPLLEHLECDSYESRFSDLLQTDTPITLILASDGGARDDLGSFGWAISIGQEILWKWKGPTFGLRPGSFRAESIVRHSFRMLISPTILRLLPTNNRTGHQLGILLRQQFST
jgi:hypothetical protein